MSPEHVWLPPLSMCVSALATAYFSCWASLLLPSRILHCACLVLSSVISWLVSDRLAFQVCSYEALVRRRLHHLNKRQLRIKNKTSPSMLSADSPGLPYSRTSRIMQIRQDYLRPRRGTERGE
ncbi:hypothetical protein QE152_g39052 [Popillia japonica]|uniref:Uncharacterized protein n=1 Tax=Popillia japonica TaxID=7064 RepID=A0AAW1HVQ4_POPJA